MMDNKLRCQGIDGLCFNDATKRRQNTAYHDDNLNWVTLCDKCFAHNEKYWYEKWKEYYAGCL